MSNNLFHPDTVEKNKVHPLETVAHCELGTEGGSGAFPCSPVKHCYRGLISSNFTGQIIQSYSHNLTPKP